ncbi:MAG: FHA domain-containing protein, partial [Deltaproteobacteria bacterium]|nr:FHA domain-containing protein [Deltaproteobacteria bacterium]
ARPGVPVVFGAPVPTSEPLFALEEMLAGGRPGRALATASTTVSIGSGERTDLCYPGDEGLGVIHCEFSPGIQSGLLRDLSGGLGTFVRIPPGVERRLYPGDRVRVGSQMLRVDPVEETARPTAPPDRSSGS